MSDISTSDYKIPGTLKFWCQKVLPLVYDDSLSYYELLCKVVDYINNLIHDNSATIDNMDALLNAFNQLQDYVNESFDELNVYNEVSEKIDRMAEDGELLEILEPVTDELTQYVRDQATAQQEYNAQTRAQTNSAILQQNAYNEQTRDMVSAMVGHPFTASTPGEMSDTTKIYVYTGETTSSYTYGHWYYYNGSAWIDGGEYNSPAIQIDSSLNSPGDAADAGAVGVRLRQFAPRQEWTYNYRLNPSTGVAESYTGQSTEHAITDFIDCSDRDDILGFDYTSGLGGVTTCAVFIYDENGTYLGYIFNSALYGYVSPSGTMSPLSSAPTFQKIRFDVNITTYTAEQFPFLYPDIMTVRRIGTDKSLKAINVPADAKAVGVEITHLKQDINELNTDLLGVAALPITETAGYYNNSGVIQSPTSALEVCTNRIPISEGGKIKITVDFETTAKQWGCYCVWRENGTCIGRTVFEDTGTNKNHFSAVITAPADAYEISFSYRTYGTHTTVIQYMTELYNKVYSNSRKLTKIDFADELKCSYSIGGFHNTTGELYATSTFIRDERFIYMPKGTTMTFHPIANNRVYDFIVYPYDKDFHYLPSGRFGTWLEGYSRTYEAPTNAAYVRVTMRYDNNQTMTTADFAVFANAVTFNVVSGEQNIVEMIQDVADIAGFKYLPSYWQTYLDGKKADIDEAINSVGNHGDYFTFFTDYHMTTNAKRTPAICKWVSDKCNLKKVVCGGDILKTHTHDDALNLLNNYRDDFANLDIVTLYGNHDRNIYADGSGYDHEVYYSLAFDETYNSLFKRNELVADLSMDNEGYFSVDNSTQKIKYIFLNTGDTQTHLVSDPDQYEWFFAQLNDVKDGWYVVVFAHMLYEISGGVPQIASSVEFIKKILDTYQGKTSDTYNTTIHFDFTNAHGNVACLIGGHIHIDYSVDSDAGYPIILTTCDSMGEDTVLTRTLGTVSEQAIDLFFIDTTAKTINTIRIGTGSDRSFTFT